MSILRRFPLNRSPLLEKVGKWLGHLEQLVALDWSPAKMQPNWWDWLGVRRSSLPWPWIRIKLWVARLLWESDLGSPMEPQTTSKKETHSHTHTHAHIHIFIHTYGRIWKWPGMFCAPPTPVLLAGGFAPHLLVTQFKVHVLWWVMFGGATWDLRVPRTPFCGECTSIFWGPFGAHHFHRDLCSTMLKGKLRSTCTQSFSGTL